MFYSCFNQGKGLYDYFQNSLEQPINSDLPIPKLPSSTGRIGVPAIEAGRPLPASAKFAGSGWHARGMIVQCAKNSSLGAIDFSSMSTKSILAGSAIALGLVYFFGRPAKPTTYAISGVMGGLIGYWIKSSTSSGGA